MGGRTVKRGFTSVHHLDPAAAAPLLSEVMPIGGGDLPTEVIAWRDRATKRWTRFRADYPNGFRLSFNLSARGVPSRVTARIKLCSGGRA